MAETAKEKRIYNIKVLLERAKLEGYEKEFLNKG